MVMQFGKNMKKGRVKNKVAIDEVINQIHNNQNLDSKEKHTLSALIRQAYDAGYVDGKYDGAKSAVIRERRRVSEHYYLINK